ncbi:MAG: serine/threonine protein kinase, partial [Nannocystis sp.]|nr:serine/threonine protein kinase [Nannocystis sp.]
MPADPSRAPPSPVVADVSATRLQFESPEDLLGHTLNDRYQILRLLGSGGMGTVYLAEHVLIHKQVAVKVLSPTHARKPEEVERFLREARAASRIRHENVVDITDFGYTGGGLAFLVMEYLDGEDLASTSHHEGALPWRRAVHITRQICAALAAAHAQGVIHRDMKPENVFRIRRGEDPDFIKVLDFGIAKIIDENYDPDQPSYTGSGLMGTPEYVAPELIRGLKPDVRVDIYAVGVILYRLLTGRVPFAGENFMATLTAHLMEAPKDPRELAPDAQIPEAIAAVCLQSLAKDRDQRIPTIREFALALRAAETAPSPAPPSPVPLAEPARRRLLPILLGVALLLLLAVTVLYAYRSGRDSVPELARGEVQPVFSDMIEETGPKGQVEPVSVPAAPVVVPVVALPAEVLPAET